MARNAEGQFIAYNDIWLLDGVRTAFADYNGILGLVSPIDLGIKVARAVLERTKTAPSDVGSVIAGSVAQASFDAYMLPRHIGLYASLPIDRPALLVQRVCGTGVEAMAQAGHTRPAMTSEYTVTDLGRRTEAVLRVQERLHVRSLEN